VRNDAPPKKAAEHPAKPKTKSGSAASGSAASGSTAQRSQ
jgi:hypothetical protein